MKTQSLFKKIFKYRYLVNVAFKLVWLESRMCFYYISSIGWWLWVMTYDRKTKTKKFLGNFLCILMKLNRVNSTVTFFTWYLIMSTIKMILPHHFSFFSIFIIVFLLPSLFIYYYSAAFVCMYQFFSVSPSTEQKKRKKRRKKKISNQMLCDWIHCAFYLTLTMWISNALTPFTKFTESCEFPLWFHFLLFLSSSVIHFSFLYFYSTFIFALVLIWFIKCYAIFFPRPVWKSIQYWKINISYNRIDCSGKRDGKPHSYVCILSLDGV